MFTPNTINKPPNASGGIGSPPPGVVTPIAVGLGGEGGVDLEGLAGLVGAGELRGAEEHRDAGVAAVQQPLHRLRVQHLWSLGVGGKEAPQSTVPTKEAMAGGVGAALRRGADSKGGAESK